MPRSSALLKSSITASLALSLCFTGLASAEESSDISNRIRDLTLSAKIPLGELNVGEWTSVDGAYRIQISPNQDRNSYSRREQFNFNFQLGGDVYKNLGVFGRSSIQGEFIRQFPSQRSALSIGGDNRLYTPSQSPHSSRKALALKKGEYYSAEMRTSFEIGASTAELNGLAFLGGDARYIISGDFKLEVYRRSGSRVFVRASSLKEKSTRARIFTESRFKFEVFGFDPADSFVEDQINVTIFEWDLINRASGKLFTVEYEYDLSNSRARAAYDKLMNPTQWRIKDLAIFNPARAGSSNTVRRILAGKIEATDALARQTNQGVLRSSQSETDFTRQTNGIKVNLLAASTRRTRNYLEQDFQFQLGENRADYQRYKIATLSLNQEYDILIGWREREILKEANIIFELDRNLAIKGFEELSFKYQRSDVRLKSSSCPLLNFSDRTQIFDFCQKELPAILGQFRKMMPESWHNKIDLEELFAPVVGRPTFLDLDLIFSPKALTTMQRLSTSEIEQELVAFTNLVREKLTSEEKSQRLYYGELEFTRYLDNIRNNSPSSEDDFYRRNIERIKDGLSLVLTPTKDKRVLLDQWRILIQLQKNRMFRDLGSGMLVRLLERATKKSGTPRFSDLVYFSVHLNARGLPPISKKVGDYERPEYTSLLIRTQNSLLNRSFDPSYFAE